jgi:hypothetical protein
MRPASAARSQPTPIPAGRPGLTYDAGALLAADRNEPRLWALHRRALERGVIPVVPASALAQATRDGRCQANLARLLEGCAPDDLTWEAARAIGQALGRAGAADVVDAHVVVGCLRRGDTVVTSDPADLRALAVALRRPLNVIPI